MSKHLRGFTRSGTTFGMDVDGKRAAAVMRKSFTRCRGYKTEIYESKEVCLNAADVASLMGSAAWLITENRDFTHVQFDDSAKYRVIYPEPDEADDARKMARFLGKALLPRRSA